MKRTLSLTCAAVSLIITPSLADESNWYGDIGYQHHSADEDGIDADLGTVTAHAGYKFTPNLSVEGELGFGIVDEEIDGADLSVSYLVGAYGRVEAPIGENLSIFARAGVVQLELDAAAAGTSASESETGAGYGIGGEFHFDGANGIRADYTRYDIDSLEVDAFYIGYSRKF